MREWADILNDWKCGSERELEMRTVELGARYEHWWCGLFQQILTIDADNKNWIEEWINDPLDDLNDFRKLEPEAAVTQTDPIANGRPG